MGLICSYLNLFSGLPRICLFDARIMSLIFVHIGKFKVRKITLESPNGKLVAMSLTQCNYCWAYCPDVIVRGSTNVWLVCGKYLYLIKVVVILRLKIG